MPTKLTDRLLDDLTGLVRQGVPINVAVASKHINEGTFRRWRQRASERPESIYAILFDRLNTAAAEAKTLHVAVLTNAATRPTTTTTTITKRELRDNPQGGNPILVVIEEITRTTVKPPDPKWSAWQLERTTPEFRATQQIAAQVQHLPPDMAARTMGELLRLAQGGDGPSMLRDGDVEARALLPTST